MSYDLPSNVDDYQFGAEMHLKMTAYFIALKFATSGEPVYRIRTIALADEIILGCFGSLEEAERVLEDTWQNKQMPWEIATPDEWRRRILQEIEYVRDGHKSIGNTPYPNDDTDE